MATKYFTRDDYFQLGNTGIMEIQLENMVAHFFCTFPFTLTDLAENLFENRLILPSQHSQNTARLEPWSNGMG